MSNHTITPHPLPFILLRDGHAAPLAGISPDEIKKGAKHLVPHPEADPIQHRRTLKAIVGRLGGMSGCVQRIEVRSSVPEWEAQAL